MSRRARWRLAGAPARAADALLSRQVRTFAYEFNDPRAPEFLITGGHLRRRPQLRLLGVRARGLVLAEVPE